ncbi:permease prefix domain 1-containing protein [Cryobacterium serini]|uniref:Uncharacterized protein n=1 Tax=Cryobacterium serini TaxID=1259201 RepID=A0A4R9BWW4_9MICO|nr:permease prefix domain 1-containing protein [Cryobacterium serini]TFD91371.1 hypothetical protein E3T51_01280 [Cryobacterium serini]
MTAKLTQRYITATTKNLGTASESDVRAELEGSIADAIDARVEQGIRRADAERAVLTELGDPALLAAAYADRPLHLIGPRHYLTWARLLKILLATVPLFTFLGIALMESFSNDSIGEIIAAGITMGLSVAVHVTFWVTLLFAVLERIGTTTRGHWNVDRPPDYPRSHDNRGDSVASLTGLTILAAAMFRDGFAGPALLDAEPVAILNPDLWPWAISGLFTLIAARAALSVRILIVGRWTTSMAILNTTLAILFMSLITTLLGWGELINPEVILGVIDAGASMDIVRVIALLAGLATVGFASWSTGIGWQGTANTTNR